VYLVNLNVKKFGVSKFFFIKLMIDDKKMIKLLQRDSKDINNIIKYFYFKQILFKTFYSSKNP